MGGMITMSEKTTAPTILIRLLRECGYDGLTAPGCSGCGLVDLIPCWDPRHLRPFCVPAYHWDCPCEWHDYDGAEFCPDDGSGKGCYRTERQPKESEAKMAARDSEWGERFFALDAWLTEREEDDA